MGDFEDLIKALEDSNKPVEKHAAKVLKDSQYLQATYPSEIAKVVNGAVELAVKDFDDNLQPAMRQFAKVLFNLMFYGEIVRG